MKIPSKRRPGSGLMSSGAWAVGCGLLLMAHSARPTASLAQQEASLPAEATELLAKAQAVTRYQAQFSLEAKGDDGEQVRLEGNMIFERPNRRRLEIRLEGEETLSQLHVSDGQVEWQYIPAAQTAYRAQNPPEPPGPHRPFADLDLASLRFVTRSGEGAQALYEFEASPLESITEGAPVPVKTVRVSLAQKDGLVRQVVLLDDRGETVLTQRYDDVQVEIQIPAETFTFQPPAGVEVVEVEL